MSVDSQRLAPVSIVRICTFQGKASCYADYDGPAAAEIMTLPS